MIGGLNPINIKFGGKFKDYTIYTNDNFPFYGSVENHTLLWHIGLKSDTQEHLLLMDNTSNGRHKLELGVYSYITNEYKYLSDVADLYGELKSEFDTALKMLYNILYKPVAYIGEEIGNDSIEVTHYILCSATKLISNSVPYAVIIGISVRDNKANVISINKLNNLNK